MVRTEKQDSVLITGGSGLIGRYLTSALLAAGYRVSHLSRSTGQFGKVRVYRWDPEKEYIDPLILEGTNHVIHLAGANIGEKRWTGRRMTEIINSRVNTSGLIFKTVSDNGIRLKSFISASAIGYYGSVTTDRIFTEEDLPAADFLGTTCRLWEEAADLFEGTGARVLKIRTGVVLAKNDSALSKMLLPARFGLFPLPGTGNQYLPWIHIDDLCRVYLKAISEGTMTGAYNAVAPEQTDYRKFVMTMAEVMKKPFLAPRIPAILMRIAMGKSSVVALRGSRISPEKLISAGFVFSHPALREALSDTLTFRQSASRQP